MCRGTSFCSGKWYTQPQSGSCCADLGTVASGTRVECVGTVLLCGEAIASISELYGNESRCMGKLTGFNIRM